jgi:hypothetical protein
MGEGTDFLHNFISICVSVLRDFAMDSAKEKHPILCNSRKKCDRDPGNDYTSVRGRNHEAYRENLNSPRPRKARQVKSKVRSMLIIFFDMGIAYKGFVVAAQTVSSHTTVTFYGDYVKMCKDFAANFGDKVGFGCCITKVKGDGCVGLTTLPPSVRRLSRQSHNLIGLQGLLRG